MAASVCPSHFPLRVHVVRTSHGPRGAAPHICCVPGNPPSCARSLLPGSSTALAPQAPVRHSALTHRSHICVLTWTLSRPGLSCPRTAPGTRPSAGGGLRDAPHTRGRPECVAEHASLCRLHMGVSSAPVATDGWPPLTTEVCSSLKGQHWLWCRALTLVSGMRPGKRFNNTSHCLLRKLGLTACLPRPQRGRCLDPIELFVEIAAVGEQLELCSGTEHRVQTGPFPLVAGEHEIL